MFSGNTATQANGELSSITIDGGADTNFLDTDKVYFDLASTLFDISGAYGSNITVTDKAARTKAGDGVDSYAEYVLIAIEECISVVRRQRTTSRLDKGKHPIRDHHALAGVKLGIGQPCLDTLGNHEGIGVTLLRATEHHCALPNRTDDLVFARRGRQCRAHHPYKLAPRLTVWMLGIVDDGRD